MKAIVLRLERFWYSPAPAERLAILRWASGGFSLWYLLTRFDMVQRMARSDSSMFEPVGLANILTDPLPPVMFTALYSLGIALNVAYIMGWKFKWTGPVFALLLLFLLSYRNSWSMIYHSRIALVLHVLVIGFVSSADAYSFDAWWRKRKGQFKNTASHWRYGWPIKLVCLATVLTYFLSGVAKVFGELAWQWVTGSAMRSQVAIDTLRKNMLGEMSSPLFEWLYPHTELFMIMGITTFILELGAPLAMINKRVGMAWAVLTWLMHWGIFAIMGIRFRYQMTFLIFLPFFDVEKVIPYLKKRLFDKKQVPVVETGAGGGSSVVLFDGLCNFCDRTVRFVIDNDDKNVFRFASQQSGIGKKLLEEYNAPKDTSTIVLIEDARVYTRSTAIFRILKRLRSPFSLLYVLIFLPLPLREMGYKLFAKYRYRWFGVKNACELPTPQVQAKFL